AEAWRDSKATSRAATSGARSANSPRTTSGPGPPAARRASRIWGQPVLHAAPVTALVEIRVPTYRRPAWLRHALTTIVEQSLRDWRALVFDDLPDREGE